jgi:hypothetical protein
MKDLIWRNAATMVWTSEAKERMWVPNKHAASYVQDHVHYLGLGIQPRIRDKESVEFSLWKLLLFVIQAPDKCMNNIPN